MARACFTEELSIGYPGKAVNFKWIKNATTIRKMFKTANGSNTQTRGGIIF